MKGTCDCGNGRPYGGLSLGQQKGGPYQLAGVELLVFVDF